MGRLPEHFWFKHQADVEFGRLRDCYLVTDGAVAERRAAWEDQTDAICAELGDDEAVEEFLNDQAHIYDALSEHYPSLIRQSMFLTAYGRFEHLLNVLCQRLQQERSLTVTLKDLNGSGIERAKSYLKKVCCLPFPDGSPEWTTIKELAELRNILAHRDGELRDSDKKALRFLKEHAELVTREPDGVLLFSEEYVPFVLDVFSSFLTQVYAVLPSDGAERN